MGTAGVAQSREQVRAWTAREAELKGRGARVFLPDAAGAVPPSGAAAKEGLRTMAARA